MPAETKRKRSAPTKSGKKSERSGQKSNDKPRKKEKKERKEEIERSRNTSIRPEQVKRTNSTFTDKPVQKEENFLYFEVILI